MNLQDCPAIVTGAASGMGAATAKALAKAGAKVAFVDLNFDAEKSAAETAHGLAISCNVADADNASNAFAVASRSHGPARILVNCAGIAPASRIVNRDGDAMPLADFKKVIDVNLIGTFNMMRLFAAELAKTEPVNESGERGVIINTASVAAYEGQIGQAAYAASKGGVVALTIQAAREFSSLGIRVVTIAPGLIGTPMLLGFPQNVQDSLAQQVPFPKRFGYPQEYAKLALHIIDNQMLNGEVIRLDGAIRMQPR